MCGSVVNEAVEHYSIAVIPDRDLLGDVYFVNSRCGCLTGYDAAANLKSFTQAERLPYQAL